MNQAEIEHNFEDYRLNAEQEIVNAKILAEGKRFALLISELTRETPEQTTAIRCIEQACGWAKSAIVRYPKHP